MVNFSNPFATKELNSRSHYLPPYSYNKKIGHSINCFVIATTFYTIRSSRKILNNLVGVKGLMT